MALDSSDVAELARLHELTNHGGAVLALADMHNTPTSTVVTAIAPANTVITSPAVETSVATTVETTIIATSLETPVESAMETIVGTHETTSIKSPVGKNTGDEKKDGEIDNEECCNRRVFVDASSTKTRRCGQKPVVLKYTKQKYCEQHKNEHVAWKKTRYQNSVSDKKEKGTDNYDEGFPSMSMLCSLSHDGFYLNIIPGSHKPSFMKKKGKDKIHLSVLEQIYVPQTYMILFHKWLYHCGSASLENEKDKHSQERLFSYVVTEFNKKKRKKSSDGPSPIYVNSDPKLFCKGRGEEEWLCTECDHEKMDKRGVQRKNYPFSPPPKTWTTSSPGNIVDGNLERDGYVIIRTSIVKEECEFLLQLEEYLVGGEKNAVGWENICNTGGQPDIGTGKRQQFALECLNKRQNKPVDKLFKYTFEKLRKDILKVNPLFEKEGEWTQAFKHRKVLRNVGACLQQYPHTDYNYDPIPKDKRKAIVKATSKKEKTRVKRGKF